MTRGRISSAMWKFPAVMDGVLAWKVLCLFVAHRSLDWEWVHTARIHSQESSPTLLLDRIGEGSRIQASHDIVDRNA